MVRNGEGGGGGASSFVNFKLGELCTSFSSTAETVNILQVVLSADSITSRRRTVAAVTASASKTPLSPASRLAATSTTSATMNAAVTKTIAIITSNVAWREFVKVKVIRRIHLRRRRRPHPRLHQARTIATS